MGAHRSVFISSARADRELAEQITKSLDDAGLIVKRPETERAAGELWADAVKSALTTSDLMVFIIPSEGSAGSNNAFFEAGVARALEKPVVTVFKSPSDITGSASMPLVSAQDLPSLINQVQAALRQTLSEEVVPPEHKTLRTD